VSNKIEKILEIIPSETFESYRERINGNMYKEPSIVIGVIDSIFSIGSKYESTIKVVNRFIKKININRNEDDYTTKEFIRDFVTFSDEELANDIFKNRQRTSTTNGVLKAAAVKQIINIFDDNGIQTKKDLLNHKNIKEVERQVRTVKGQASGVSFDYIMMHAGDENRFKPDRHIYTFFEKILEYGKLTENELEKAFFDELAIVKEVYPYFTARSLDSLIWEYVKFKYQSQK
jgi:hypothetical protein